jgi:hypothetical protein
VPAITRREQRVKEYAGRAGMNYLRFAAELRNEDDYWMSLKNDSGKDPCNWFF